MDAGNNASFLAHLRSCFVTRPTGGPAGLWWLIVVSSLARPGRGHPCSRHHCRPPLRERESVKSQITDPSRNRADMPKENHWNDLAQQLGAEIKPDDPAAAPTVANSPRPAPPAPKPAKPKTTPPPRPRQADWSQLASSLGLEPVAEAPPAAPRPAPAPRHREPPPAPLRPHGPLNRQNARGAKNELGAKK